MRLSFFYDTARIGNVYWRVLPVLIENNQNYWEIKNSAVFPAYFETNQEWNREFFRKKIELGRTLSGILWPVVVMVETIGFVDFDRKTELVIGPLNIVDKDLAISLDRRSLYLEAVPQLNRVSGGQRREHLYHLR